MHSPAGATGATHTQALLFSQWQKRQSLIEWLTDFSLHGADPKPNYQSHIY